MSKQQPTTGRTARRSSRTTGPRAVGSLLAVILVTGLGVHVAQSHETPGRTTARSTVASGQTPWNSTGS
jgi:hypothetical protein